MFWLAFLFLLFGGNEALPDLCSGGSMTPNALTVHPDCAIYSTSLNSVSSWCAADTTPGTWFQYDLGMIYSISSVSTQGRANAVQWVTSYKISISQDGTTWTNVNYAGISVFSANYDQNTIVTNNVFTRGRYIRIIPQAYYSWPSLRSCIQTIPDIVLSATTQNPATDTIVSNGYIGSNGGWCPSTTTNLANEFLQIDLGRQWTVTNLYIQGRSAASQWLTLFQLFFSSDGINYIFANNFTGNTDQNTVMNYLLTSYISTPTRYFKIKPLSFTGSPCMRVGIQTDGSSRIIPVRAAPPPTYSVPGYCAGTYVASSEANTQSCLAYNAILNNSHSWCPSNSNYGEFLEIDYGHDHIFEFLWTQGRADAIQWTTSFYLWGRSHGALPGNWFQIGGLYQANSDQTTAAGNYIGTAAPVRWLRIYPVGFYSYPALRVCIEVANPYIAPSTPLAPVYPCIGTYNATSTHPDCSLSNVQISSTSTWCPAQTPTFIGSQYLSIDMGTQLSSVWYATITTQGRADASQYVTSYYVNASYDNVNFVQLYDLFHGNGDQNTVTNNYLWVQGYQYYRIIPVSFWRYPSMRACISIWRP